VTVSGLGYAAAVALAVIFSLAAIAKARDLEATEQDFTALGVPRAAFFARFVPIAEFSIVILLLIVPPAGAIAALVTLAFFTTFLIGRLRAGVRVPCACFGAAKARPISAVDIARNFGLMILAGASLGTDRPTRVTLVDLIVIVVGIGAAIGALRVADRVRSR
jgi:uncharacterized membrane protein YphA (DoxX/SURF4 family)